MTNVTYAGHDALVELALVPGEQKVRARIAAPFLPAIGSPFGIAVKHPALVFPVTSSDDSVVSEPTHAI